MSQDIYKFIGNHTQFLPKGSSKRTEAKILENLNRKGSFWAEDLAQTLETNPQEILSIVSEIENVEITHLAVGTLVSTKDWLKQESDAK